MADALPVKVERKLYRGDSRTWTHEFETNTGTDAAPVWEPTDITGWTFLTQFRADLNRGEVIATSTTTVTDGPAGVATEELSPTEADKLPGQSDPNEKPKVYWDLQSTDTEGAVHTWKYAIVPIGGDSSDA